MKTVAVLLSDEMTTRRLALAFRNRCVVRRFETLESVKKKLSISSTLAFVVDMRGRTYSSEVTVVDTIAMLRATWPSMPIVAYVNFSPQRMRDVMVAAHAGATEIILDNWVCPEFCV